LGPGRRPRSAAGRALGLDDGVDHLRVLAPDVHAAAAVLFGRQPPGHPGPVLAGVGGLVQAGLLAELFGGVASRDAVAAYGGAGSAGSMATSTQPVSSSSFSECSQVLPPSLVLNRPRSRFGAQK